MPQLARNEGWLKLIANAAQLRTVTEIRALAPDPEAERIRARKERKRARRLETALGGGFTRSRRVA